MRIRIKQSLYRDRYGVEHKAGDVADLPDHVAVKLIGFGIGEAVREAPIERAAKKPSEKTTKTNSMQRKGASK